MEWMEMDLCDRGTYYSRRYPVLLAIYEQLASYGKMAQTKREGSFGRTHSNGWNHWSYGCLGPKVHHPMPHGLENLLEVRQMYCVGYLF